MLVSASWDAAPSDLLSLSLFADSVATAKLPRRETRNFTSSVSDSRDGSVVPQMFVCVNCARSDSWNRCVCVLFHVPECIREHTQASHHR